MIASDVRRRSEIGRACATCSWRIEVAISALGVAASPGAARRPAVAAEGEDRRRAGAVVRRRACAARALVDAELGDQTRRPALRPASSRESRAAADRQVRGADRCAACRASASTRSAACSAKARNVVHLPPTMQSCGGVPVDLGDEMVARDAPGEARVAPRQRPDAAVADRRCPPAARRCRGRRRTATRGCSRPPRPRSARRPACRRGCRSSRRAPAEIGKDDADPAVDVLEIDHVAVERA